MCSISSVLINTNVNKDDIISIIILAASFVVNFTTGSTRRHLRSAPVFVSSCDNPNNVCVMDVNSHNFQHVVMAANKVVSRFT